MVERDKQKADRWEQASWGVAVAFLAIFAAICIRFPNGFVEWHDGHIELVDR